MLLEQQDRSAWDPALIREGISLVEQALSTRRFGPYTLQAAIAAVHAEAPTPGATDWRQIRALYGALLEMQPSPVIELNRAAAVAMHEGPAAGLALIDAVVARGELRDYHLVHSARADLLRRLGRRDEARAAYGRARELAKSGPRAPLRWTSGSESSAKGYQGLRLGRLIWGLFGSFSQFGRSKLILIAREEPGQLRPLS